MHSCFSCFILAIYFIPFPFLVLTEGQWQLGDDGIKRRHGWGRFSNGGEKYEGEFKDNNIHGRGKYQFASGAIYEGEWVNNKFQGRGTYTWPSGAAYTGTWIENK